MTASLTRPGAGSDHRVTTPGAVPVRAGGLSWRLPLRGAVVVAGGLVAMLVLLSLDLAFGDLPIPVATVVETLLGGGDPGQQFIVRELRLPQAAVAAVTGAALGLSGALTQTFARNPLASPDILGVTEGASAGAVAFIVVTGTGTASATPPLLRIGLPGAALAGGLGTAALLYLVSWRRGIDGHRLVLIGIGIGAAMTALTSWFLVKARLEDAVSAQVWLTGSLASRGWAQAVPVVGTLVVLVPVALVLVATLNVLQLGDDTARVLGVRLQWSQLLVLVVAVALAAVAVSAVGPLDFVAFVVPQVALRLGRGSRPPLVASMVLGACLVLAADLVSRVVLPFPVPAGVVTSAIGAPYLIWLLLRTNRRVSA